MLLHREGKRHQACLNLLLMEPHRIPSTVQDLTLAQLSLQVNLETISAQNSQSIPSEFLFQVLFDETLYDCSGARLGVVFPAKISLI